MLVAPRQDVPWPGCPVAFPQTFHFESRRSRLPPGRVFCSQEFHTAIREQSPFLVSSIYTAFHLGGKKKAGEDRSPLDGRRHGEPWGGVLSRSGPCPCPRLVGREECGLCNYLFAAQGQKAKVTIKMRRNPRIPRPSPGPSHSRQAAARFPGNPRGGTFPRRTFDSQPFPSAESHELTLLPFSFWR